MGGGVSRYSVEKSLSHSAENFCRRILYCCNNFGYREILDRTGGWEYQDFPSRNFCLTVPKSHVVETFIVALFCGSEKVYEQEGGGEYQVFPTKFFCLTGPKIPVGETFTVALVPGTGKVWIRRGSNKIFRRKTFVSQSRKLL